VAAVLDAENEAMRKRHIAGRAPFMQAGALAPTMGIVGTVFGLVNVMNNLNQPSTLGPLIAAAFLATLIGVGSANVVFLPVANRLKALSEEELDGRTMVVEGILAIQSGDNPRVVAEKLISFVPPDERDLGEAADGPELHAVEAEAA
jgi:chemotaxis protein MotA